MKALLISLALTIGAIAPAHAQQAGAGAASALSDGVVRKVDNEQAKLTIKHGPIPNIGMPDMTMVFRVSNPQWLDQIKAGDRIRFSADKISGQYTVTGLEIVK